MDAYGMEVFAAAHVQDALDEAESRGLLATSNSEPRSRTRTDVRANPGSSGDPTAVGGVRRRCPCGRYRRGSVRRAWRRGG